MSVTTRRLLRESGVTDRQIAAAIETGTLIRIRGGLYADPSISPELRTAVTAGGRLACASELKRLGVWVLDEDRVHVHFTQPMTRRLDVVRHWRALTAVPGIASVSVADAVAQTLDCLPRRAALAAVDSALHLGLVAPSMVATLPLGQRAAGIRALADGSAESGLESLARLIVHDLGLTSRSQVSFTGIGRVDLVVEGVVVVEADGDKYHTDPAARRRDRRRDALLAAIDRPVLRFGYDQLVGRPDEVARAIIRTVVGHSGVKNPRAILQKASRRARKHGWA